ncbi:MAG TPA: hypothetical protein VFM98_15160 [Ramlibacter sp.]|uniref:hypothetical protein n=1 Tax=Ramlibacter sp. TaxID=1917967 RepID=UPI002D7E3F09|nr:hypothetical protein [Ramlibacter sp.]HET8746944.1 hypothetical protein [Ramlibacter sp.]
MHDPGPESGALPEAAWAALLRAPLPYLDAPHFAALQPVIETGKGAGLRVEPTREVKRSLAPWTRRFGTMLPVLTARHAAADELLEDPEGARQWLEAHPELCAAVPVLDDLLIAACAMQEHTAAPAVAEAAAQLAYAAADLVLAAGEPWPQAQVEWADHKNRPTLRLVAQAIDRALALGDAARAQRWMRWMLERNPQDDHGWRTQLANP